MNRYPSTKEILQEQIKSIKTQLSVMIGAMGIGFTTTLGLIVFVLART